MKNKQTDTFLVVPSDLHSGGTTSLFPHYKDLPNGYWQFKHTRYTPSGKQCEMAAHFDHCADVINKQRKGKRLIIVGNGDLIDGKHHQTLQLATHNTDEQNEIHIWLMKRFFKRVGFDKSKGDLYYVVSGTETHTAEKEDYIAEELGAEQSPLGEDLFDFLPLEINGRMFWFLHQGAGPGKGTNMGNALRNWLGHKYWECLEKNWRMPDMVISGHYHVPVYNTFVRNGKTIHGLICPPFQTRTRFGYKVAAAEKDNIGIATVSIKADGTICMPDFLLMKQKDEVIKA